MVNAMTSWTLDVETEHGITQMVARPSYVRDEEWLWTSWGSLSANPIRELADFEVRMYLDDKGGSPFGRRHAYGARQMELPQAEAAVKVLRKVKRALEAVEREEGYLAQDDFARYLFRVGKALGVTRYRVRNTDEVYRRHGELYRLTDAAGVQMWVTDRIADRGRALRRA